MHPPYSSPNPPVAFFPTDAGARLSLGGAAARWCNTGTPTRLVSRSPQVGAYGGDLGTVLAFVPIIRVDEKIIQGVLSAIPGESADFAERFSWKLSHQRHDVGVDLVEFAEDLSHGFLFAQSHLRIVKLIALFSKLGQVWSRTATEKRREHIDQHLFIGGQVGDDLLYGPDTTCPWCFPC